MKTKDLIAQLNEADPSGELECCVGNADIHFVSPEPAYWDGCLQVLERDYSTPYYNIIGAKYVTEGTKIVIRPLSIQDAIFNDEHLPVTYEGMSEQKAQHYRESDDKHRETKNRISNEVECDSFVECMVRKYGWHDEFDREQLTELAKEFYANNMSYEDAMPEDIKKLTKEDKGNTWHLSWRDRRHLQWEREIGLVIEEGKPIFRRKV